MEDDDLDVPEVVPGTRVLMERREASYLMQSGGRMHRVHMRTEPMWLTVLNPFDCCDQADERKLGSEICPLCLPAWASDYYISLGETPADLGFVS